MTTDQRLARLERQNARMKVAVAGMAVVLAVVLLIGAGQDQGKPKVLEEVRARRLVVEDDKGIAKVTIRSGGIRITTMKASVNLGPDGLQLLGASGSTVGLYSSPVAGLTLYRQVARLGLRLRLNPRDGSPAVCLFDKNGRVRCILGAPGADTIPEDPVHDRPESSLVMYDADGNPIFTAPK